MKNKFFKIGAIVLSLGIVGGLVVNQTNPELMASVKTKMVQPFDSENDNSQSNSTEPTGKTNSNDITSRTPNITAEAPVNPTKKAIVEVGSTGYNYFVINVDKNRNYEVLVKEFGMSYAKEGLAGYNDIKKQLREYIYEIANKHGVSSKNIHFVLSSGALKNPKIVEIAQAIQDDKFVVNRVTAEQEGKYAFNSLVLPAYKANSFYIDIGSGNTKISWYENGTIKTKETYGAKYSQDDVKDADVIASIRNIIKEIPDHLKQHCFVIGGIPYKLVKEDKKVSRYQFLRNSYDMNKFKDDKDYQRIKNGYLILNTVQGEINSADFIFDHDANFSIGYLITL